MAIFDLFKRTKTAAQAEPATAPVAEVSPFDRVPVTFRLSSSARDLPIVSTVQWDSVSAVREAMVELNAGRFLSASLLLDSMLSDSHVTAKIEDRTSGLFGAPFDMKPPPGFEEDAAALKLAGDSMPMWRHVISDDAHTLVLRDGIMLGVGLGEVVIDTTAEEWKPRLKHWHARHLTWRWTPDADAGFAGAYWVTTMRGMEQLRPDGNGGFYSEWTGTGGEQRRSRWMLYTPYGYQRGWASARIKAIAIPWLLRMWAFRDWGRHSEILGIPPKVVKVPAEWSDEEKQRALRELTALASEGTLLAPTKSDGTGFDVELLELKGPNAHDTFDGLIERAEAAISVALVGQTLTTQMSAKGGSRAAGEVHERVELKLCRKDNDTFSRAARSCIVVPWVVANVGAAEMAPVPCWQVSPPADLKTKGDGLKAVGDGISALEAAGVPVDRAQICSDAGLPLEEGAEFGPTGDDEPAEGEEPLEPGAPPADGAVVQDTALNGAQVTALQGIVQSVADGALPETAARALIRASFPNVPEDTVNAMLAGLEAFEPKAPDPAPLPPGAPGGMPPGAPPVKGEPDDQVEEDDAEEDATEEEGGQEQLSATRRPKKRRAAAQGQVYADQLADHGRQLAARILAGDVRALKQLVAQLEPSADGGIDLHQLRERLVAVYRGMNPDELARLTEKCLVLAELSGRYALQKEL
jgi:phage gp29-like protein